jgi:KAP family P-loop domain
MPALHADAPITTAADDRLGRSTLAKLISAEILQAPADAGFVVSLMGPWGAGKTSVLNLVEGELDNQAEVLRFDPWLFSGAEQLVTRFFSELGAQLRSSKSASVRAVADRFASYGDAISPLVPLVFGRTGAAVAAVLQRGRTVFKDKGGSASAQRSDLQRRLASVDRPIVVFIDDIDRLTAYEMREVVRLVKLVGDLPGVRYLLAFDRRRVELALGDRAEDGRAYLEKIVQAPHDLPMVSPVTLRRLTLEELNERIGGTELPFFSQDAWGNLFGAGIAPMLSTLRDARRFANVAPAALQLMAGEIAAQDVLALEALRLFDPDVHNAIPDLADVLTGSNGIDVRPQQEIDAEAGERTRQVLEGSAHPETTRELLRLLFPPAGHLLGGSRGSSRSWRAQRRVASRSVLEIYLQATIGEEAVTTARVRESLEAIGQPARLRQLLEETPDEKLADLCDRLTELQSSFPSEHADDAAMVVALQERRLPERQRPFSPPPSWSLIALVDALLHKASDPAAAVQRMVDAAPDLSHALRTANRYGTFANRDERSEDRELLDEQTTAEVLEDIRGRVRRATTEQLRDEPELRWLLAGLLEPDEEAGHAEVAAKARDDRVMRALVRQSFGWGYRSNDLGTSRVPQLDWQGLTKMLGREMLEQRVRDLAPHIQPMDADERSAWDLARRYAAGEDPPRFP